MALQGGRAHAGTRLPLLDLPPGILSDHIIPRLPRAARAALSLACAALRRAVSAGVRALAFHGGSCCLASQHALHAVFPGVESLTFTPSNLHEAMNVVPTLVMTVRTHARRPRAFGMADPDAHALAFAQTESPFRSPRAEMQSPGWLSPQRAPAQVSHAGNFSAVLIAMDAPPSTHASQTPQRAGRPGAAPCRTRRAARPPAG
jgi:hypothetical protein